MGGQLVSHKSPETTVRPCWRSFHVSRSIYVEAAATAGPGSFVAKGDEGHCQSKFVYFAKTSEPDFAVIDFPAFFRVDLSGSMAAASI
jgi:hypothetical protein